MTQWINSELLNPAKKVEKGALNRGMVLPFCETTYLGDLYIFSLLENHVSSHENVRVEVGETDN